MDPLLEKYMIEKFGPDYQKKAQSDYEDQERRSNTGSVVSSIGNALAGRDNGTSDAFYANQKKAAMDSTLGRVADGKKMAMNEMQFNSQMGKAKHDEEAYDPNSQINQKLRASIMASTPKIAQAMGENFKNVTVNDYDYIMKPHQFAEQIKSREEQARILSGNQREAREMRQQERDDKRDEKLELLDTSYGRARTPDDAKKIKEASVLKKNFDGKLDELIEMREKAGGGAVLDRTAVKRAEQLSKDLLLDYKSLSGLGVLSQSDMSILNSIIPDDPLQFRGPLEVLSGQDATLSKMKSFKQDKQQDFQHRLNEMLREPKEQKVAPTKRDEQAIEWAMQNPDDPRSGKILEKNGVKVGGN